MKPILPEDRHQSCTVWIVPQHRAFFLSAPLFWLALLLAAGCATVPQRIQESVSPFDGAQEIALEPALVCRERGAHACSIKLGLFRRSTMHPDKVILIVLVEGSRQADKDESLHLIIDGEETGLSSIDARTRYRVGTGPHTTGTDLYGSDLQRSIKRYLIDKSLLERIITARSADVRVDLVGGSISGRLLSYNGRLAIPAFREFYERAFGPIVPAGTDRG